MPAPPPVERLAAAVELFDELRVDGEAVGHAQQLLAQLAQARGRHRRLDLRAGRAVELVLAGVGSSLVLGGGGDLRLQPLVQQRQVVPHLLRLALDLLLGDHAFGDQPVRPQLGDALLGLDLRVHLRLRVGGLVGLVVAEAAVADQVDQDVVAELLAEGEREPHGAHAGGHVVGVDVDDRHVEALRQVRGPARRAGVVGVGREADLVVRDDVHRAADLVAVERLQVERLRDDALGRERRVAVDHDRHRRVRVLVGVRALARGLRRARGALDDRRDVLQVARVGLEVDADRAAVGQLVGALRAVVVLDVAGAALRDRRHRLERRGALELGEDRVVGAAEVVGEHVQPAAVRHADDDLLPAVRRRQLDQLVEHRHGHVEALDRELVLAEVGLVHEALQRVDLDQALEQRAALVAGQLVAERARTRCARAATRAGGARRCARSRRRSCRSRSRAGAAARRRASRRGRTSGRASPGSCAWISGVRPSASGSRPGSPSGSEPSGSRRAARWPWLRTRLTSVLAACTACSSSSLGRRRRSGGAARRRRPPRRQPAPAAARGRARRRATAKTLLVEAVLALQVLLDQRQEAPDSAPWMMRWS